MDRTTFEWILGPEGQEALADLAERNLGETDLLHEVERLRRSTTPERARAALEVALARRRAALKFPQADRLYFTREALEQASAAPVAAHRAERLAGAPALPTSAQIMLPGQGAGSDAQLLQPYNRHVADLCCGAGGDALALAAAGLRVTAVDQDELRLALCRANAEALGFGKRIETLRRDLLVEPPPAADALFCDPGRRAGGKRRFAPDAYEPPLGHVLGWRTHTPALGIKLGPGIDRATLPEDAEVEFVSLDGELKEATLWCGPLATTRWRATVLRKNTDGKIARYMLSAHATDASPTGSLLEPSAFLYEPDPAVIRAGLVRNLGVTLGAAQLDPAIAYLTSSRLVMTPFARAWPILSWMPFSLKGLRARLRAHDAGVVTVKKRGSPLDTDTLARRLSGTGSRPLVVVLTQAAGRPVAVICVEPLESYQEPIAAA